MDSKTEFIESLTWKIHRILNKFNRMEESPIPFEKGLEVTHNDIHVIQAIGDKERMNVTELGQHFGITKSAASQKTTRLARMGLVQKKKAAHNDKELHLALTQTGWRAYGLHEQHHGRNIAQIVGRLSAFTLDQVAVASVLLDVIEGVMDERLAREQD